MYKESANSKCDVRLSPVSKTGEQDVIVASMSSSALSMIGELSTQTKVWIYDLSELQFISSR
jgi:hypothetical protein